MSSSIISIDHSKCVGCALCAKDCPAFLISIEDGKARYKSGGCIGCGHCYAVCPQNAITLENQPAVPDENITLFSEFNSEKLLSAMKSRRSVRRFTKENIGRETVNQIIEAGRYCPTGANAQGVRYVVLGAMQDAIEKECVSIFRSGSKLAAPFSKFVSQINIEDDFFFRNAPLVIAVIGKSGTDAALASSYMEIMAESLGLGVFYSGFFVMCSKISPKIRRMLNIGKGEKVRTCLVIGHPNVKYQRIPPRKSPDVTIL